MPPKKTYYKKGYLIEFMDGSFKLVTTMTRVSYEHVKVEREASTMAFNTDYMMYSSPKTKYGLIPVHAIKDSYEIKWLKVVNSYEIYDLTGNCFKILD